MLKCGSEKDAWPFIMVMRKSLILSGVVATAVVSMYVSGRFDAGGGAYSGVMPDFALEEVSDAVKRVTAASLVKRPAIVNVWASWCLACRDEHALLLELAESGRIALYGVNYLDTRKDANRWLDYFGNPFELSVYDNEGSLGKRLGVEVLPDTFLLGPDGRILYEHVGPLTIDVMEKEFWPRLMAAEAIRE